MKTYRIFFRGSVDVESQRKPKKAVIERCIPTGAAYAGINVIDENGDAHVIDCRARHCSHYGCDTDKEVYMYCTQCDPEAEY